MVNAAFIAENPSFGLAFGGVVILVFSWVVRWPLIAGVLLGGSVVLGQAVRVPVLGQAGGLLLSDIAVVGVLAAILR